MKRLTIVLLFTTILMISCGGETEQVTTPEPQMPPGELIMVDSIGVEIGDSLYMFGSIEGLTILHDGSIVMAISGFGGALSRFQPSMSTATREHYLERLHFL